MSDPRPEGSQGGSAWAEAAVPGRRIGHAVEFHDEIGSTNDRAREALAEPGGDGLAVVADRQRTGRGRMGRTWVSPPGVNLLLSVGMRLDLPTERAWWLSAAAILALRDVASAASGGARLAVRWPNDLVTADGLKVAGLLVETQVTGDRVTGAVIGMGLNVNWRRDTMPADISPGATSLADLAGGAVDRIALLGTLLSSLDVEIGLVEDGITPVSRFRRVSWLTGRSVEVETPAGRLTGVAGTIADDGGLVLDGPTVTTTVSVGEVIRVHAAAGAA